jgi:hypothetical protein
MIGVSNLVSDSPSVKLFRFEECSAAHRFVMGAF